MTGTGQLLVLEIAAGVFGGALGYLVGRILRRRDADAIWDEGYNYRSWEVMPDGSGWNAQGRSGQIESVPRPQGAEGRTVTGSPLATMGELEAGPGHPDWREQVAAELAPEALAQNVPEPGSGNWPASDVGGLSDNGGVRLGAVSYQEPGLGHPSPYAGQLTPAQRRRDKHKQRGQYAPGDLPDPPTDIGAWWQAELTALLEQGQSEWLTRNLEDVAA